MKRVRLSISNILIDVDVPPSETNDHEFLHTVCCQLVGAMNMTGHAHILQRLRLPRSITQAMLSRIECLVLVLGVRIGEFRRQAANMLKSGFLEFISPTSGSQKIHKVCVLDDILPTTRTERKVGASWKMESILHQRRNMYI